MRKIMVLAIFFGMAWFSATYTPISSYVVALKNGSLPAAKQANPLYQEIVKKAPKYEIQPSDAKIDTVWKATPGYNGLKVNIEASYNKMKKDGKFNEEKLVFEQVAPKTHLNDLPPSPIYRGHPNKPMVSFLINVAWGNEYLPSMLATLKKDNVSASFFLEGNWVKKNPDLAKMIVDAGHEVGNHSYSHPDMKLLSATRIRDELNKTNEVIKATTGVKSKWFAPPSGSYRDETVKIAAEFNMKTVMWTVDTIDWQKPSPDVLIQRVMSKIGNGSIILMHPTEATAKSMDRLIKLIQQKGLEIGTVSSLMDEERIK
ncbi:polysaccharide deacetylase family protein [Neobacillus sp. SM06]|uniref:polysaccharide deacetylase family protein n=1 Tax=Neobacillus sp. SM06 TaxID=3422492 RepID=UPI003D2D7735